MAGMFAPMMISATGPFISPFPPNYVDEPLSYGLALFSDLIVTCLCLAVLFRYALEARRHRHVRRLLKTPVQSSEMPSRSLAVLHRRLICGLMIMMVARSGPDAVLLLVYGEVGKATLDTLAIVDWWGDTFATIPCIISLGLLTWTKQAVDQQLANVSQDNLKVPGWPDIKQALAIGLLALLIAVGLTLGKASV